MIDIQLIRDNPKIVEDSIARRGLKIDLGHLLDLDVKRRKLLTEIEGKRAELKIDGKPDIEQLKKLQEVKKQLEKLQEEFGMIDAERNKLLAEVPNFISEDTPTGSSEDENISISKWGKIPEFDYKVRDHVDIGELLGVIDLKRAAKVSGSRFAYLMRGIVKLQFAIVQWTMDTLTDEEVLKKIATKNKLDVSTKPFIPMLPPMMLRTESYAATSRLKAEEVTYKLADDDLWLIGSAEHSMVAMYQGEILDNRQLPIRYLGYSTSFRREAGTYGKDMHGILRMHHFDKLEMESFTLAKDGMNEHLFMIAIQEYLMQQLKIPYQVLLKCTADMGTPNFRGVDIEAWIPSQKKYRETHSADYMTDYQSRRLNSRIKNDDGKLEFVHTNDATAFAMGRTMIAIIENNQQKDGSVKIPKALQKYYGSSKL